MFFLILETVKAPNERDFLITLYCSHSTYVKSIALNKYPDLSKDIDDIVNSVFVRVIINRQKFTENDETATKSLLYIYTVSVCIDILRKKNKQKTLIKDCVNDDFQIDEIKDPKYNLEKDIIQKDAVERALALINKLSYPAKDIVRLKYLSNHTTKEISQIMNISETNVRTILKRSLENIRKNMGENIYDE